MGQLKLDLIVKRTIETDAKNKVRRVVNLTTAQAFRNSETRTIETERRRDAKTQTHARTIDFTSMIDNRDAARKASDARDAARKRDLRDLKSTTSSPRKREGWEDIRTSYDADKEDPRERTERAGSSVRGLNREARHTGVGHGMNGGGTRREVKESQRWQKQFAKVGNGFKQRQ